jgi:hypothetical protein
MKMIRRYPGAIRIGAEQLALVLVWGAREIVHTINDQRLDYGIGLRFGKFFCPLIIRKSVAPIALYDLTENRMAYPARSCSAPRLI